MKKFFILAGFAAFMFSCSSTSSVKAPEGKYNVKFDFDKMSTLWKDSSSKKQLEMFKNFAAMVKMSMEFKDTMIYQNAEAMGQSKVDTLSFNVKGDSIYMTTKTPMNTTRTDGFLLVSTGDNYSLQKDSTVMILEKVK